MASDALWFAWDHLFGLVGLAMAVGLVQGFVYGLALGLAPHVPPGAPLLLTVTSAFIINGGIVFWAWSGFRAYARIALLDGAAGWNDFQKGLLSAGWSLRCGSLVMAATMVMSVNALFYWTASGQTQLGAGLQLAAATAGMLVFWGFLALLLLLWAGMSDPTDLPPSGPLNAVRLGFQMVMMAPGAWWGAILLLFCGSIIAIISILGVIFLLPMAAWLGVCASIVGGRHREFLLKARESLGPDASTAALTTKADELWAAYDARQPRRTLRHLLRPWED